jgi:hypothetical protein
MDKNRSDPMASETDSAAVADQPDSQDKAEIETSINEAGEATPSHQPAKADEVWIKPEKDEEEYILNREPDGRYRIVGRRPCKED